MEGSKNIKSTGEYLESGLVLNATMILKTIMLMKEIKPPVAGFQIANISAASPIPHITKPIIVSVFKPLPTPLSGFMSPSIRYPIPKSKTNAAINVPIMIAVQRMVLINFVFPIFLIFNLLTRMAFEYCPVYFNGF